MEMLIALLDAEFMLVSRAASKQSQMWCTAGSWDNITTCVLGLCLSMYAANTNAANTAADVALSSSSGSCSSGPQRMRSWTVNPSSTFASYLLIAPNFMYSLTVMLILNDGQPYSANCVTTARPVALNALSISPMFVLDETAVVNRELVLLDEQFPRRFTCARSIVAALFYTLLQKCIRNHDHLFVWYAIVHTNQLSQQSSRSPWVDQYCSTWCPAV